MYFIEDYGLRFYDLCKDVKYLLFDLRVMDFVGGGVNNYIG